MSAGCGGPASVTRFAELPNGNLVAAGSDVSVERHFLAGLHSGNALWLQFGTIL